MKFIFKNNFLNSTIIEKKIYKIELKKIENDLNIQENLNLFKTKINNNDILNINKWEYTKKNRNINNINKNNTKTVDDYFYKFNFFFLKKILNNVLEFFIKINFRIDIKKNFLKKNFFFLIKNFNRINLDKKIKKTSYKNTLIMVLDNRTLKSKISFIFKNKTKHYLSNGIILKNIQINEKKNKKSSKITFILIKSGFITINNIINYKNIIINVKGVKNNFDNLLNFIKKNVKTGSNLIFLNNFMFSKNKKFKFKKIKSIKRRLKKKIIKKK